MRAAYLNQGVNMFVLVLMVPLLVHHLDVSGYLLWAIFTTFGGLTLQFESAIQMVVSRELATAFAARNVEVFSRRYAQGRLYYLCLALASAGPLFLFGLLYTRIALDRIPSAAETAAWTLFSFGYATNYYFGVNNNVLLATGKTEVLNNINSFSRALYFGIAYFALHHGYGIVGLCVSFLIAVICGCLTIRFFANRSTTISKVAPDGLAGGSVGAVSRQLVTTLAAFVLYKGGLLVSAALLPPNVASGHALMLQTAALLSAAALVPTQVWLSPLVHAVEATDESRVKRIMRNTWLMANACYLSAAGVILLFGNDLLAVVRSNVTFPGAIDSGLLLAGFWVELNISLMIGFLATRGVYSFARPYVVCSTFALGASVLATVAHPSLVTLIVPAVLIQSGLALPAVAKLFRRSNLVEPSLRGVA